MLTVEVPTTTLFNEATDEFVTVKGRTLTMEHSLISLSKWESKWRKPFLSKEDKSREELRDYIRCMCLTRDVTPEDIAFLPSRVINEVKDYIETPQTATIVNEDNRGGTQVVTSELIYSWMVSFQIPFETEKWHLTRLLTLVRVIAAQNSKKKPMSAGELAQRNRSLNAARREKYNSKG